MSSEELDKYRVYMEEFRKNMDVSSLPSFGPLGLIIERGEMDV